MKNNHGFIATSLIYSFFLIFIALLALLIRAYIYNRTIIERYNNSVMNTLNSNKYIVEVYLKNCDIEDGQNLNNLVLNGQFEHVKKSTSGDAVDSTKYVDVWDIKTSAQSNSVNLDNTSVCTKGTEYLNCSLENNQSQVSLIQNNININNSNTNYIQFDITPSNPSSYELKKNSAKAFLSNTNLDLKVVKNGNDYSYYGKFSGIGDKKATLRIDLPNADFQITNVRILDLTNQYQKGKEPGDDWIYENVNWFPSEIKYYVKKNNYYGQTLKLTLYSNKENEQSEQATKLKCYKIINKYAKEFFFEQEINYFNPEKPTSGEASKVDLSVEGDIICKDY